jgi:hypothetical protein
MRFASERDNRYSLVYSTIRGSGLHHSSGWPLLYQG